MMQRPELFNFVPITHDKLSPKLMHTIYDSENDERNFKMCWLTYVVTFIMFPPNQYTVSFGCDRQWSICWRLHHQTWTKARQSALMLKKYGHKTIEILNNMK